MMRMTKAEVAALRERAEQAEARLAVVHEQGVNDAERANHLRHTREDIAAMLAQAEKERDDARADCKVLAEGMPSLPIQFTAEEGQQFLDRCGRYHAAMARASGALTRGGGA